MQWITVSTPPVNSIDQLDAVIAEVGEPPEGLQARYVGTAGDELRIVSLWDSKAHADHFFGETLGPVLAKVLGPEPDGAASTIGLDVARHYVRD